MAATNINGAGAGSTPTRGRMYVGITVFILGWALALALAPCVDASALSR